MSDKNKTSFKTFNKNFYYQVSHNKNIRNKTITVSDFINPLNITSINIEKIKHNLKIEFPEIKLNDNFILNLKDTDTEFADNTTLNLEITYNKCSDILGTLNCINNRYYGSNINCVMNIHYNLDFTDIISIDYLIEQSKFLKSLTVNLIVKTDDISKLQFKQVIHPDKVSITTEPLENKPGFSKVIIKVLKF